jgi:hypothetical protein
VLEDRGRDVPGGVVETSTAAAVAVAEERNLSQRAGRVEETAEVGDVTGEGGDGVRNGGESGNGGGSDTEVDSGSEEGGERVCRICSDDLTPEQFVNGEAIELACECKGALKRAHKECALKW